jgi:hypothetical protein
MADKITGLRNWINGEVFNARDYVYERNLIVNLVNGHEDRIRILEAFDANLGNKYLDKTVTTAQSVAGLVDFTEGIELDGALLEFINTEKNIGLEAQLTSNYRLRIGQNIVFYGKALGAIDKGDAVQFVSAQGDHFLIKKAVPSEINANPELFIGVSAQTLANEGFGFVVEFGPLTSVLKEGFVQGNILWFASEGSTPGAWTKTKPERGFAQIRAAAVVNSQNAQNGQWLVRISILEATSGIQTFLQDTEPENMQSGDLWFDTGGE